MSPQGLGERLVGGVLPAATLTRPPGWDEWDEAATVRALDDAALRQCLERVGEARRGRLGVERVESIIAELHTLLASRRAILLGVLFGSDPLINELPPVSGASRSEDFDRWFRLCWIVEASWRAVTGELHDLTFAPGDRELLYPLAARMRFLTLSEPMRFRAARVNPWLSVEDVRDYGPNGVIGQVFGMDGWNLLIGRCREARHVWLTCLNGYQSHPLLATAQPGQIETELAWLVFARRYGGLPLGFSVQALGTAAFTAEDRAVIEGATDQHLLPRFRLFGVAGLALYAARTRARVERLLLAIITVLAIAAAIYHAARLQIHPATVIAAVSYGLIAFGSLVFGPQWTAFWLLRLPAACSVGLAVLITLPPDWWQTPRVGWAASVVLVGAAYGYLVVEARNHGVDLCALVRSAGVVLVGVVHSLLVSLIGLVAVAPAFIDKGDELAALWQAPGGYGQAGMILVLSTSWCLAVGVFSQILWDDRPVTARLAHLHWRTERSA